MGNNEARVYTFENVLFQTADQGWEVSAFTLILQENGIPTARLTLDPGHWAGEDVEPATTATLGRLVEWHDALQVAAQAKEKASFQMDIVTNFKVEQAVRLDDWIVTAAGMTGISATGGFALEVEIQHPICITNYTGLNLGSFVAPPNMTNVASSDIVAAFVDGINKYATTETDLKTLQSSGCGATNSIDLPAIVADYKSKLTKTAAALVETLEWKPALAGACEHEPWPLDLSCFTSMEQLLADTLAEYVSGGIDGNIWELLVRHLCPQWQVSVLPTWWMQKLIMTPFTPWGEPSLTVVDTDISDINLPGVDPAPVAGVICHYQVPGQGGDMTALTDRGSDREIVTEALIYAPEGKPDGTYVDFSVPAWLNTLRMKLGGKDGSKTNHAAKEAEGKLKFASSLGNNAQVNSESSDSYVDVLDTLRGAAYYFANQAFLTMYRQMMQITLTTRLLFKSEGSSLVGNWIVPGQICRVEAGSEENLPEAGKVFVDFYVTNVIHIVDCQAGNAHTEIDGRYVRPKGGFADVAENGTCNALYEGHV